ncbi:hypothetical protein OE165_28195, partial [Escherichia coli]|uniref:hypothetical protein n=1 Tax=Escherichia coli TaxID=562 RepID=UPI0021F2F3E3
TIQIDSKLVGDAIGLYGFWNYRDVNRLSLMSVLAPSPVFGSDTQTNNLFNSVGFGEGAHGVGGFGQGQIDAFHSTVVYNIP